MAVYQVRVPLMETVQKFYFGYLVKLTACSTVTLLARENQVPDAINIETIKGVPHDVWNKVIYVSQVIPTTSGADW